MKVLHVYRTYYPDGASGVAEAIRQICFATKSAGIESAVYALSPRPDPRFLEENEARIGRAKSYAAPASCDIGGCDAFRLFRQMASDADLVNYHFPWPFADLLHMVCRPKVPALMTWHSDIVRQKWSARIYAPLMNFMIGKMDAIVATSPTYASTSPVLSRPRMTSKLQTIPLGVDEASLPASGDTKILNRLGLSPEEPYFLFVGATRYYKGLHFLIEAAARMPAKFVIAGSGPELEELKQRAARFPTAHIIFAGRVSDPEKVDLLKACRALVLPSHLRSEAYGMVLVEASIFAKPMVTCDIGSGTSYVNIDGETGFVVPPADATALASALNRLLSDPVVSDRMGAAARRRYEKLFTGRAMGQAYARTYQDVLAAHQTAR